ncbi:hypothetical protein J2T07_002230 [Luteibacter jiangsuensis]|uniref:Enoyl-ACP reductase-like protein n=1 Tax=Luteibacter jiangsuensis TaxID=637577 RepID=A0ABT9SYG4_9GAMM|nr:hypothetical protein [Luteibacter jiangsuensis]MDQ0010040.1 hypothetical protein [Luteibacter jiangsuensis]
MTSPARGSADDLRMPPSQAGFISGENFTVDGGVSRKMQYV